MSDMTAEERAHLLLSTDRIINILGLPWASDLRAAIAEQIRQAEAAARLIEGTYVAVPVEPTETMMEEGDDTIITGLKAAQAGLPPKHPTHASHEVYQAMLKAAQE